jgi:hypothetical protein
VSSEEGRARCALLDARAFHPARRDDEISTPEGFSS